MSWFSTGPGMGLAQSRCSACRRGEHSLWCQALAHMPTKCSNPPPSAERGSQACSRARSWTGQRLGWLHTSGRHLGPLSGKVSRELCGVCDWVFLPLSCWSFPSGDLPSVPEPCLTEERGPRPSCHLKGDSALERREPRFQGHLTLRGDGKGLRAATTSCEGGAVRRPLLTLHLPTSGHVTSGVGGSRACPVAQVVMKSQLRPTPPPPQDDP